MVGPAVTVLFLVTIGPLLFSLLVSFTDLQFSTPEPMHWIGLGNYVTLVTKDYRFLSALARTFVFVLAGVIAQTLIGYLIAAASQSASVSGIHFGSHPDSFRHFFGGSRMAGQDDFQCVLWSSERFTGPDWNQRAGLAGVSTDGAFFRILNGYLAVDAIFGVGDPGRITEPASRVNRGGPARRSARLVDVL